MDHAGRAIRQRHGFAVPAVVAGLAVAVPLAAAAGPSVGQPRPVATAVATERAEQLIQYVSEAVRQFCGSQAAVVPARPFVRTTLPPAVEAAPAEAADFPRPSTHAALPQLIDLPPPIG